MAVQRIDRAARDAGLNLDGRRPEMHPTHEHYTRAARPMLLAVGAAVTLVFLIACANVGLLMVLRGMRRRKEIAVRAGRLARLLLAESVALLAAATAFGLLLAWWVLRTFGPAIEQQLGRRVPGGAGALSIEWSVLAMIGWAMLVVAIILSLAPLAGGRHSLATLRERRSTSEAGGRRIRSALIAIEVAGSLALLVGCGLRNGNTAMTSASTSASGVIAK